MFGFFKKKQSYEGGPVVFDVEPQVNSLTPEQRRKLNSTADELFSHIHRCACVYDYKRLTESWIIVKKQTSLPFPEMIGANVASFMKHDANFAERVYDTVFPIAALQSVKALSRFIDNKNPNPDILNMIAIECAVWTLKRTFLPPKFEPL